MCNGSFSVSYHSEGSITRFYAKKKVYTTFYRLLSVFKIFYSKVMTSFTSCFDGISFAGCLKASDTLKAT